MVTYSYNEVFHEILCKNFPEQCNLFKIENHSQIANLFNDLNANCKETALYFRWYDSNEKDIDIYSIQRAWNSTDGDFWLINNKELYIKCLWIYKYDIGYDFIVVENIPMKTNNIFGQCSEITSTVAANFEDGEYMSYENYSGSGEERIRYVKNMLFVLSPDKSSIFNAFWNKIIESLFKQYKNNNYIFKDEFLKNMIYPNIQRNIRGIITYD